MRARPAPGDTLGEVEDRERAAGTERGVWVVRGGPGCYRRQAQLAHRQLTALSQPELLSVEAFGERSQMTTLVLHSASLTLSHEVLAGWIAERVGGGVRSSRWEQFEGGCVISRGRRRWVLCEDVVARAVLDVSDLHGPAALCEIAKHGRGWGQVAAGLRRAERRADGSIRLGLRNDTAALTALWPGLSPAQREVARGLAPSWEGGATGLCEAAAGILAEGFEPPAFAS